MAAVSRWMRKALELAREADYHTSPNPMVGAVVVRDDRVVGAGYHRRAGEPHAEIEALRQAGEQAKGADLYVTLEPCTHQGQTGPCVPEIMAAGVSRVVAAMPDPNPRVNGSGIRALRQAGIEVQAGDGADEAAHLNRFFVRYISCRLPFVSLKYAMSLDGKIATACGESRWISGEASRQFAHELRHQHDAVLVGVNTVLRDDPQLTVRDRVNRGDSRRPLRIVLDSRLRTPPSARVAADGKPTLIATTAEADRGRRAALEHAGVEVLSFPEYDGKVDLRAVLEELGRRQHISVLVEGGAAVHAAALTAGLADQLYVFVAPMVLGGEGVAPVGSLGLERLDQAPRLTDFEARPIGGDILLTARPLRHV